MSSERSRDGWITARTASAALIALSLGVIALLLLPFLKYLLLAVVLAYVLMPVQRRLERRLPSTVAALTLVVVAVTAIIVPVMYLLAVAIREIAEFTSAIVAGDGSLALIEERLGRAGIPLGADGLVSVFEGQTRTIFQGVTTSAVELVGGAIEVAIGLTISVFVLYSLLAEGDRLVRWIEARSPLDEEVEADIVGELDRLMWASVVGNAAIALLQAVLLALAVALLGIPGAIAIGAITFLAALLPLIGVVVVWLPLSVYLLVVGRPIAGVALVGYGLLISASDNYLRAVLIGRGGELSVATVVVGIFGGVALLGFVGLFVGPVLLGGSKVVIERLWDAELA